MWWGFEDGMVCIKSSCFMKDNWTLSLRSFSFDPPFSYVCMLSLDTGITVDFSNHRDHPSRINQESRFAFYPVAVSMYGVIRHQYELFCSWNYSVWYLWFVYFLIETPFMESYVEDLSPWNPLPPWYSQQHKSTDQYTPNHLLKKML